MEWLSNPWATGVGGGVITGLLVMLIVRRLFSAREQREYYQNVAIANNEILYAIRPAITEKIIPSSTMLDALLSATARKYGIDSRDLLSKPGLANELIKEIIDDTFLSSQQKVEFCELLAGMKRPETDASSKRSVEVVTATRRADASDPSGLLGMSTALTAFMITMFFYMEDKVEFLMGGQLLKILPMLAIVSIIPIFAFLLFDLTRQMTRPRPEIEDGKIAAAGAAAASPTNRDLIQLESRPMQAT